MAQILQFKPKGMPDLPEACNNVGDHPYACNCPLPPIEKTTKVESPALKNLRLNLEKLHSLSDEIRGMLNELEDLVDSSVIEGEADES